MPQLIPPGFEVTVPFPLPCRVTCSVAGRSAKLAVTTVSAASLTVQTPVPVQAPPQLWNVEVPAGVAVSVTVVPIG